MDTGFIEVRDPDTTSPRDIAATAAATGATFALVIQGDTPIAFIPITAVEMDEVLQVTDRVDDATSLTEVDVDVEGLVVSGSSRTFFTERFAILLTDSGPAVLEAGSRLTGGDDLRSFLNSDSVRQAMMLGRLPGPAPPMRDPLILYRCSRKHFWLQKASSDNRVCPRDQGVLSR